MMEILFRGKRKDNGEWVFGSLMVLDDEYRVATIGLQGNNDNFLDCVCAYKIIPETVGQYTGLTDKNGKKIFEGDIVACGEYIYSVEWKQDRCGFGYGGRADKMLEIDGEHCEVIGNIHETQNY